MMKRKRWYALFLIMALALSAFSLAGAQDDEVMDLRTTSDDLAYVRVGHFVVDAPAVDVYLNKTMIAEGLAYPDLTPYLLLDPKDYKISLVPTGEAMEDAVLGPVDISVEAGHDYTVAATGQIADETFDATVIDETALYMAWEDGEAAMDEPAARILILHGISNAGVVDVWINGEVALEDIDFGQAKFLAAPADDYDITITAADDPDTVVAALGALSVEADRLYMLAAVGTYPDDYEVFQNVVGTMNLLDIAAQAGEFETLLAALQKAELTDTLMMHGPFTVFAPDDAAFEALLTELDIEAADLLAFDELADILLYHVVEGYWTSGEVAGIANATTMYGAGVSFSFDEDEGLFINDDVQVTTTDILAKNGVIHVIDSVLLLPSE